MKPTRESVAYNRPTLKNYDLALWELIGQGRPEAVKFWHDKMEHVKKYRSNKNEHSF